MATEILLFTDPDKDTLILNEYRSAPASLRITNGSHCCVVSIPNNLVEPLKKLFGVSEVE